MNLIVCIYIGLVALLLLKFKRYSTIDMYLLSAIILMLIIVGPAHYLSCNGVISQTLLKKINLIAFGVSFTIVSVFYNKIFTEKIFIEGPRDLLEWVICCVSLFFVFVCSMLYVL